MKKIFLGLMLTILMILTGCEDGSYIDTTKSITFDDGVTVEEIVTEYVNAGEFYELNYNQINANLTQMIAMFYMTSDGVYQTAKDIGLKLPKSSKIKWEVSGKTNTGKVLTASSDNVEVSIQTFKDGDYISLYQTDIKPKMKEKKYYLTQDQFTAYSLLYKALLEKDNQ